MDWHVTPALFDDTGLTIIDTWHRALLIHFFYIAHRPACHVSGWHWELCQVCSLFQNLELRAASLGGILTQKAGNHRFLDLKDVTQRLTFVQVFAQHSSDLFVLVQGGTTSGNLAGPHLKCLKWTGFPWVKGVWKNWSWSFWTWPEALASCFPWSRALLLCCDSCRAWVCSCPSDSRSPSAARSPSARPSPSAAQPQHHP